MNLVWFAHDTELAEVEGEYSVETSALGLPADLWPNQIIVNGYSYTSQGGCGPLQLYKRDSDGKLLTVKRGLEAMPA